jgi:uncharacterized protein YndB with AHSA1/START domain
MKDIFGSEFRRVENRDHLGQPAVVAVAVRSYDTSVDDLWNALTTPDRLARWFAPVEGDLKLGGRYQVKGNAGGAILRCDRPTAFDLTWEFGGGTSWVNVRLAPEGKRARMTLEHIAHRDGVGAEHFKKFGPGAVGIGWDLTLYGLGLHVAGTRDKFDENAWSQSEEGKRFVRESGAAWGEADVASGEEPAEAQARAERTIKFYTGA